MYQVVVVVEAKDDFDETLGDRNASTMITHPS